MGGREGGSSEGEEKKNKIGGKNGELSDEEKEESDTTKKESKMKNKWREGEI